MPAPAPKCLPSHRLPGANKTCVISHSTGAVIDSGSSSASKLTSATLWSDGAGAARHAATASAFERSARTSASVAMAGAGCVGGPFCHVLTTERRRRTPKPTATPTAKPLDCATPTAVRTKGKSAKPRRPILCGLESVAATTTTAATATTATTTPRRPGCE